MIQYEISLAFKKYELTSINNSCILWRGEVHKDYGRLRFTLNKIRYELRAHRARAFLNGLLGDINSSLIVCHKCNNKLCINLNHLYIGTEKDNIKDCIINGNHVSVTNKIKKYCPNKHLLTPENTRIHKNGTRQCKRCQYLINKKARI